MNYISKASLQVVWNRVIGALFNPSREIQQGDPLSLYIFVLCIEFLSQAIVEVVDKGSWKLVCFGKLRNSHLFFANGLIIFREPLHNRHK